MLLNARARKARIPLSGTFELSPVCNLACKMCYVRKTPAEVAAHHRPLMKLEQWKRIADEAFDLGTLFLLLTGGEPFLWPDFRELYEYLARKGFVLSINSNGTMITEETVAWLRENPPTRINITLYGASDAAYERLCGAKGMYSRVVSNIDRLLAAGIRVKLNASMTPYNVSDMAGIVEFARQRDLLLDLSTYMFPPIRRDGESVGRGDRFTPEEAARYALEYQRLSKAPEQYLTYLSQAARGTLPPSGLDESCVDPVDGQVRCQAGRASWWITWDGWMTPCGMMPEPKADVTERGFAEAWRHTVEATQDLRLSGLCESCESKELCHCCASMAVTETGSPSGVPTYLCRMAQALRSRAKQLLEMESRGQVPTQTYNS